VAAFGLGCLLTAGLGESGPRVVLGATRALGAGDVRLVVESTETGPGGLRFEFATAMEPGAGASLALDPPTPFLTRFEGARTLRVALERPLPRARRTRVRLGAGVRAADGRGLLRDLEFDVDGAPPRFESVMAIDGPVGGAAGLSLAFDLPVAQADLAAALKVRVPGGEPLPWAPLARTDPTPLHRIRVELPAGQSPPPKSLSIELAPTLRSAAGPLPLASPVVAEVDLQLKLEVRRARADADGITLEFNRDVGEVDPTLFALEPAPALPAVSFARGGRLELAAALPPGRAVTVRLLAGFPGHGSVRLSDAFEQRLFVADLEPSIDFARSGEVLSSIAAPEIEISTTNVEQFELSLHSIYPNNLVALAHDPWSGARHLAAPPESRTFTVAAARNTRCVTRVDLRELLGRSPRGTWLVELRDATSHWSWPRRRLVQVSDLGLTARLFAREAVVSVRTLSGNEACAGVEVALVSPTNQPLARGVTDADGVARLGFAAGAVDRVPFLLIAQREEELAWLEVERHRVDLSHLPVGGAATTPPGAAEAWLHAARGIVRPGEALHATALVRERDGRAAADRPLVARWIDSRGRMRRREERRVPASGLLSFELRTAAGDPSGGWRLELLDGAGLSEDAERSRLGDVRILVEEFVAERLEVSGELAAPLVAGAPGELRVVARWLDGGPAVGRTFAVRPRVDFARFTTEAWPDATFGGEAAQGEVPPGDQELLEGVTDETGAAVVRFAVPPLPASRSAWSVRLAAEVDDGSGRVARTVVTAPAVRAGAILGLERRGTAFDLLLVDRNGALALGERTWSLSVEERRHEWEWGRDARLVTRVAVRPLFQSSGTVAGGRCELPLPELAPPTEPWRSWRVVVVEADGQRCERALDPLPARPDRLALTVSGPLREGQPFTLAVDAPFAGQALVTLEEHDVLAAVSMALPSGRSEVVLTLPPGVVVPNVHAVVTLTRPQATTPAGEPAWLLGACSLPVDRDRAFLAVAVDAPPEVRPEGRLVVNVAAKGASRATVALVDVGVLQRTLHPAPDPRAAFLAPRRMSGVGVDSRRALLQGARFPVAAAAGGGEGDDFAARVTGGVSDVERSVALFVGDVALDAEGRATVSFDLPPYEGRLRCSVIAAGANEIGAASVDVPVRSPLGLAVAAPRRLAPEDAAQAIVTLRNRSGRPGECVVTLDAEPPLALGEGAGDRIVVALEDGQTQDLVVPLRAGGLTGTGRLEVAARLGDEERRAGQTIPVAHRARFERRRLALTLPAGERRLSVDPAWLGAAVEARLVVDPRPDRQLEPVLRALVEYPWGCVEQTSSRGQALLLAHQLLPQLTGGMEEEPAVLLDRAVERILSMQLPDGGFAFWPGGELAHEFGTAAALDLLARAAAAGFSVPADARAAAARFLEERLPKDEPSTVDCFALELLLRSGRPLASRCEAFAVAPPSREGALLLASAAARLGRDALARGLLARAADPAAGWPSRRRPEDFAAPLRETALEFEARRALDPSDAALPRLAEELRAAVLDPSRLTTQEQSFALRALSAWWSTAGRVEPPGGVTLVRGEERHELESGVATAWRWRLRDPVQIECAAPRYAVLELAGMRTDPEADAFPGFSLVRELVDVESRAPVAAGAPLQRGRLYDVVLRGKVGAARRQLLLTDLLPGGLEPEPAPPTPWSAGDRERNSGAVVDHREARADRVLFFFCTGAADGGFELRHRVRAVFSGRFSGGGAAVEALYAPGLAATVAAPIVTVVP
jgi:uncharacterized protein YfaS (alpha-2-macroglobulin family)